ncbi:MAG TPA: MetS family NSS transporter small subunit [Armatimonadetes bacterium]|nr:MetS family NSS transporter small subunit [Armatimonadota bacterium]
MKPLAIFMLIFGAVFLYGGLGYCIYRALLAEERKARPGAGEEER